MVETLKISGDKLITDITRAGVCGLETCSQWLQK